MARAWSIRRWVKGAAVAGGLLCAFAAVALFLEGGSSHSPGDFTYGVVAAIGAIGLPCLGWRPRIQIRNDGTLHLRGLLSSRRTRTSNVTDMYMTGFGLRLEMADAKPFTSVVFQATMYLRYPRYVEVVHAITGRWPDDVPHP
ncbi:MAG: hypothetical protein JWR36_135 [Glaciihabitans sp.]|jgi:hypothetical protein|nr:hypothetical protein [Glaciihabitans sp.]